MTALLAACGGLEALDDTSDATITMTSIEEPQEIAELDGNTVSGTVRFSVEVNHNIDEIHFHIDEERHARRVTQHRPFELLLDTTELSDGAHRLSARTPSGKSGSTREVASADFTVKNSETILEPEDPTHDDDPPPNDPGEPIEPIESTEPVSAELVVAPWGSDGDPGTFDEPLLTLKRVAEIARPGDTILLRGGVYDIIGQHVYLGITMSGARDAPITIKSYPGERAIIDGHRHSWHPRYEDDGRSVTDPNLFRVVGDHLVWEDITFRNGVGRGFYFVGHHNVLRGIVSHNQHADGVYFQGSYNLLEHITAFDNNSVSNGGNSANGISLVDGNHIRTTHGSSAETRGNIVRHALLYRNSDDGIGVWNSWDTVIEHSISFDNGIGPTGDGRGFKLGGADRHDIGTVARFNIAFGNKHGFDTNGSTGILVYNNTSWANRGSGFILTRHSTNACDNEAYNNISYQAGSHDRIRGDCTIHEHNTWNLDITEPQFETLDPHSFRFLTLKTTSPAIDSGKDLGFDYAGNAPDIGALQLHQRWSNRPTQ